MKPCDETKNKPTKGTTQSTSTAKETSHAGSGGCGCNCGGKKE